ncbi:MAG: hydroxyacid dehydrogenase [Methylacidiphilales bacterium]|nr:hydroxyacid dehydrogenase [Candidatus Methylacidiphilales bacterium]
MNNEKAKQRHSKNKSRRKAPVGGFFGFDRCLDLAYPGDLRTRLSRSIKLVEPELDLENWLEHPDITEQIEILFATWNMAVMDEKFLARFPKLRAVFYAAGSVKGWATEEAFDRGIRISSAWAANAIPVAEYTLAVILLSLKRFWHHANDCRMRHVWRHQSDVPGVYSSVIGLISLGAVARTVAWKLADHEVEVIAYDPFVSPAQAKKLGVKLLPLEEVFRRADVISLHTPWLPETENLVNERLLRLMKPASTLINTARGAVICEPDLCRVLAERSDITAILDVTQREPLRPDSPLWTLENVILTPHIAGSMGNEITRMGHWMAGEGLRYTKGKPLQHEVTRPMLGRMA